MSRWFATFAAAAFVWTLALSASPELHQRIHADQSRAGHSCAVTAVRSGSYHHTGAPPIIRVLAPASQFAIVPELRHCWVPSPFLSAAIFEHAPPVLS